MVKKSEKEEVDNSLKEFRALCSKITASGQGYSTKDPEFSKLFEALEEKIKGVLHGDVLDAKESDERAKEMLFTILFNSNEKITFIAEELNPRVYRELIDLYKKLDKKPSVTLIGGPYIAVEDDLFLKYHDVNNNMIDNWWYAKRKGNWWKAHPVFEEAYENDKIEINITKMRRWEEHSFIGVDSKDIFVEEPHNAMEDAHGTVYINQEQLVEKGIKVLHLIKKYYCYEWHKGDPERSLLFKPISIFEKENLLKKEMSKRK